MNTMDQQTVETYNKCGGEYDEKTADFWDRFPSDMLGQFVGLLSGKQVLDIGSGPGRDGRLLQERGCEVTCVDASTYMVTLCRARGLIALEGDILSLPCINDSFAGVWAYTSLLHIPKTDILRALAEIRRVLTPNGVLALGMIEGDREEYRDNLGVGLSRFFAYYQKHELEELLKASGFTVRYFGITRKTTMVLYFCTDVTLTHIQ